MILDLFLQYQDKFKYLKGENLSDYVCFDIDDMVHNLNRIAPPPIKDANPLCDFEKYFTFNIKLPYPRTIFVFNTEAKKYKTYIPFCILRGEEITGKLWWKKEHIAIIPFYLERKKEQIICRDNQLGFRIELNKEYGIKTHNVDWLDKEISKNEAKLSEPEESNPENVMSSLMSGVALYRVFCALQILNCKNVSTTKHTMPVRQQRKQRNQKSCNEYYTLKIPGLYYPRKDENLGLWQNRLHTCRGHFKSYTAKKSLFGKYTGTYWWGSHMRGQKNLGVIQKEYKVMAPKGE